MMGSSTVHALTLEECIGMPVHRQFFFNERFLGGRRINSWQMTFLWELLRIWYKGEIVGVLGDFGNARSGWLSAREREL